MSRCEDPRTLAAADQPSLAGIRGRLRLLDLARLSLVLRGEGRPRWNTVPKDSSGKVWGPDLFAWAYDWLAETELWRGQPDAEDVEHHEQVIEWRDAIHDAGGWVPSDVLRDIRHVTGTDDTGLKMLCVVVALDRAYHGIRVTRAAIATDVEALVALSDQWETQGTLERYADGAVLRKGSHWRSGSALAHYCNDLARVSPELAHRVDVQIHNKGWSLGALARSMGDDVSIDAAYVPTLHEIDDVQFIANEDRGPRFTVKLDPTRQADLVRGAASLVTYLEKKGVDIALLPETVANDDFVQAIRRAMVANFERCANDRRLPHLRLLVIGNAGDRRNEAVVIAANGKTLFRQGKTQRWRLEANQQARYGLAAELGSVERSEDIDECSTIICLDDAGFGRVCVLICEDLTRGDPSWLIGHATTPTMILSPVFDASLELHRWAYKAAERLADEPASLVLVATSFVLALRVNANSDDPPEHDDIGVALVAHPGDWTASGVFRAKPAPDVVVLRTLTWSQVWN